MWGIVGRLLFGGFFRTAATVTTAGYFANKATNGAVMDKIVAPAFSAATNAAGDAVKGATDSLFKDFDLGKMLGDHWDKLGIAASVAGTIWGSGWIRNLSIGVLLATAAYMAYKHFFGAKTDFNASAAAPEAGTPSVAQKTNLQLVEAPKPDATNTGFNRQTAAPAIATPRPVLATSNGAAVEVEKPEVHNE